MNRRADHARAHELQNVEQVRIAPVQGPAVAKTVLPQGRQLDQQVQQGSRHGSHNQAAHAEWFRQPQGRTPNGNIAQGRSRCRQQKVPPGVQGTHAQATDSIDYGAQQQPAHEFGSQVLLCRFEPGCQDMPHQPWRHGNAGQCQHAQYQRDRVHRLAEETPGHRRAAAMRETAERGYEGTAERAARHYFENQVGDAERGLIGVQCRREVEGTGDGNVARHTGHPAQHEEEHHQRCRPQQ